MRKIIAGLAVLVLAAGICVSAGAEKTVTLSFTGDVTLGSEEYNRDNPYAFDGYVRRKGYSWFFRNMKEMFSSDDLTLVNLEGVLSDSSAMENTKKTFRFRGPARFAKILTRSGIEACAISNNHLLDYGQQGYDSTIAALEAQGILYCGNEHYFVFEKDGIRIAFFALGNTFISQYANTVKETIDRLRADGVNAVVCSFHSGMEYAARRRDRDQERYAKLAIDYWGADLVVMHHPHVVQGVDRINDRYVFYSLGNFCFGGNLFIRGQQGNSYIRSLESMVVQMDLHFADDGTYLGQEGRIYPCYISSSASQVGDPNDFQPKFVTGTEAQGVIDRIQKDTAFDLGAWDDGTGYLPLPYLGPSEKEANGAEQR